MESLWPWFAVAAAGALHGLNPAAGWWLAAWGSSADGRRAAALRALGPIAAGHAASVLLVAAAVPLALRFGVEVDRSVLWGVAAGLLLVLAASRFHAHCSAPRVRGGRTAGLALCSFAMGTAHGTGWMLVPALADLCKSDMPAREITASGSIGLAIAALAVHMAAMLAVTAGMAAGARRGWAAIGRWLNGPPGPGG